MSLMRCRRAHSLSLAASLAFACGGQSEGGEAARGLGEGPSVPTTIFEGMGEQLPDDGLLPVPSSSAGSELDEVPAVEERDCEAEQCLCEDSADCPDSSSWKCLPAECGAPSICRYGVPSAAAFPPRYACGCDGKIDRLEVPFVPDVYAYAIPALYLGRDSYDAADAIGAPCDAARDVLGPVRVDIAGSDLLWPDGTRVALAMYRGQVLSFEIDASEVNATIDDFSPYLDEADLDYASFNNFFVDENGDETCNPGEAALLVDVEFNGVESSVAISLERDDESPRDCGGRPLPEGGPE